MVSYGFSRPQYLSPVYRYPLQPVSRDVWGFVCIVFHNGAYMLVGDFFLTGNVCAVGELLQERQTPRCSKLPTTGIELGQ